MADRAPIAPASAASSSRSVGSRKRKYNWNRLFNGNEHTLVAGRDFFTSVRVFQTQVNEMAKRRGVTVRTWSDVEEARSKQAPIRKVTVKAIRDQVDEASEDEPLVFR